MKNRYCRDRERDRKNDKGVTKEKDNITGRRRVRWRGCEKERGMEMERMTGIEGETRTEG